MLTEREESVISEMSGQLESYFDYTHRDEWLEPLCDPGCYDEEDCGVLDQTHTVSCICNNILYGYDGKTSEDISFIDLVKSKIEKEASEYYSDDKLVFAIEFIENIFDCMEIDEDLDFTIRAPVDITKSTAFSRFITDKSSFAEKKQDAGEKREDSDEKLPQALVPFSLVIKAFGDKLRKDNDFYCTYLGILSDEIFNGKEEYSEIISEQSSSSIIDENFEIDGELYCGFNVYEESAVEPSDTREVTPIPPVDQSVFGRVARFFSGPVALEKEELPSTVPVEKEELYECCDLEVQRENLDIIISTICCRIFRALQKSLCDENGMFDYFNMDTFSFIDIVKTQSNELVPKYLKTKRTQSLVKDFIYSFCSPTGHIMKRFSTKN